MCREWPQTRSARIARSRYPVRPDRTISVDAPFSDKAIVDTSREMEVQNAVSATSREEVDELVEKAIAAGARSAKPPSDESFMYSRGFQDPDGHLWDFVWMDPSATGG